MEEAGALHPGCCGNLTLGLLYPHPTPHVERGQGLGPPSLPPTPLHGMQGHHFLGNLMEKKLPITP
jgi:hypothetical protein